MDKTRQIPGVRTFSGAMTGVAVLGTVAGSAVALSAQPAGACAADHFCVYEHANYGGSVLLDTWKLDGTDKEVAQNMASSAKNNTAGRWCGVNAGLWDSTVVNHAAYTWSGNYGGANDIVDWYYDRPNAQGC